MATSNEARPRRKRGSISEEEILDGAFAIAERDSVDKLSMPELAKHLGIGVTSIYWYFRKKEDLLGAMTEVAVRRMQAQTPVPESGEAWRPFLERYFRSVQEAYRTDDTMADLALLRTGTYTLAATHAVYERLEKILELLVESGFTPVRGWEVISMAMLYCEGHLMAERVQLLNNSPTHDERQVKLVVPDTMPLISELVTDGRISLGMVTDQTFDAGLRSILDTVEREHEADLAERTAAE